jgi:hypothetical protein
MQSAWLALTVLALWLGHIALTADTRHDIPASSVSVVPGTLPEAKIFARDRLRVGEWLFDFAAGDEDAFFDDENKATRQWREWKNHVRSMRAYRMQQQKQGEAKTRNGDEGAKADAEEKDHGKDRAAGEQGADLFHYFTERQVQRRIQSQIKQQAAFNKTTAEGSWSALKAVKSDIAELWNTLKNAGTSASANDQSYLGLVERHFPHTYTDGCGTASGGGDDAAAAAPPLPPPISALSLFRTPFMLEAELLPQVEKELRHLREMWSRRRSAVQGESAATLLAEAEEQFRGLDDLVQGSRATCVQVAALADPLAEAAAHWVVTALAMTQDAIVANDESTEAKRQELKLLIKQRSRLQKTKQALDRGLSLYKGVLRRHQLPNGEAVLFAMELLAKQRLGDEVQGTMEVLPTLSTTAPFTGLLEGEWATYVLLPFVLCLLVTAAIVWVAEEVKEWCLRRVQASKIRLSVGGRSPRGAATPATGRVRKLFLLMCLMEVLVPPLLPMVTLAVRLDGAREWSMGVGRLMRPSQRVVCVGVVLGLTVVNHVWGLLVRRLFHLIDPSVYRRLHAKTK